ncbi:MAG: hypothetical protein WA705_20280 [Candidatus Ozemobacteraceae bacterium]
MNLVKKSFGLMLVFLFTICFVPAFAASPKNSETAKCPNGSKFSSCASCSRTPGCFLLQATLLCSAVYDFNQLEKNPYVYDKTFILQHAITVLKQLRLPKKWDSFLAIMIKSSEDAHFELCHGSADEAIMLIKQVRKNLDTICLDVLGQKVIN